MSDKLLTYRDLVDKLGVSRRTVNRLVSRKVLKIIVIGPMLVRFSPADVERAIEKMRGGGNG